MKNYYLLSGKNSQKVASAFAPEGIKLAHELIPALDNIIELPFELRLVKLTIGKNGLVKSDDLSDLKEIWLDNQPNNLFGPLFSEKLKSIIEKNLTGNEGIDWISAIVKAPNEQRSYYIPRFSRMLDVLDPQKTMFVQGTDMIIKPVFSLPKIRKYNMFHTPDSHNLWKIPSGLYISESLKKAIQKEKLTGIDLEKTQVA